MAKKNKNQEPTATLNNVANRDIVQRISFLYQASTYLISVSQSLPNPLENVKERHSRKRAKKDRLRHPRNTADLSRSYVGAMRSVGQKTMVRMDPSLKRTLCKGCDAVLIPGFTATVRVKPLRSHGGEVVYTCHACDTFKRIPAPPVFDPDAPVRDEDPTSNPTSTQADTQAMDVDLGAYSNVFPAASSSSTQKRRQSRRRDVPRIPPLFERKGHVVFRGNERLPEEDPVS
ncbi:RNAse P Rpr2/Rpp21/SNM1 subunit domain-containing protein [Trametes elegans]|nr:RNAse P Rpr2/Rpp21/SNM1 subunit domain-containing protein [Trametes elegans]